MTAQHAYQKPAAVENMEAAFAAILETVEEEVVQACDFIKVHTLIYAYLYG
ncbi:MAG TPA: hypothetical protein VK832_14570 [Burkholderiaceae bacterium]|jgi:hypothetical protein|nr:hypothetical protein [Burkholderiaceae bacterium]